LKPNLISHLMFDFKPERLREKLGEGNYGAVFAYEEPACNKKWVVKHIRAQNVEDLLICLQEIIIGFSCDHPCLVPVEGYFIRENKKSYEVYIKFPRMKENLKDEWDKKEIKKHNDQENSLKYFYQETQLVKYFYCLAVGLSYFHQKGVFHRDIKMNNLLIDYQGNVRISDVGLSKHVSPEKLNEFISGHPGALGFQPPELVQHSDLLKKESLHLIDSWSLGLTVLELCILERKPVSVEKGKEGKEGKEAFLKKREEIEKQMEGRKYWKVLLDLIFHLLSFEPEDRLTVSDLKFKLEEEFKDILTEEFKASLKPEKKENNEAERKKIIDDLKRDLGKIMELPENQRFKNKIQDLEKTLVELLSNNPDPEGGTQNSRREEELRIYREKLTKVILRLQKRWKDRFEIAESEDGVSIKAPLKEDSIWSYLFSKSQDQQLADLTEDLTKDCKEEGINKDLTKLEIKLYWLRKITDVGMKSLGENIADGLKNLTILHLYFGKCFQITDIGVKSLSENIADNLKSLTTLSLDFSECFQVTDTGVNSLGDSISDSLKNLTTLHLYFGKCFKITDTGVKSLSEKISNSLKNLLTLHISFSKCFKITDVGVKSLSEKIAESLPNLTILHLDFSECPSITDAGVKSLSDKLADGLKNLTDLHLNFHGCQNVSLRT